MENATGFDKSSLETLAFKLKARASIFLPSVWRDSRKRHIHSLPTSSEPSKLYFHLVFGVHEEV